MRIGAIFGGDTAKHLHRSLGEIAQLVRRMPANYLRWPASEQAIFEVRLARRTSPPASLRIDDALLWSFGELHIPNQIWHAFTRYNVWVEPVLVAEWVRLMESYASNRIANIRQLAQSFLVWADPERDTRLARAAVARIREAGKSIYCVWSGKRLNDEYDIDHCFPFAAWPCGDAWNLMPASCRINNQKSNRLVTQAAIERSSDYITSWWADAFLSQGDEWQRRFYLEAGLTLPLFVADPSEQDVIDAMKIHRMRLASDQGLRPWEFSGQIADNPARLTSGGGATAGFHDHLSTT